MFLHTTGGSEASAPATALRPVGAKISLINLTHGVAVGYLIAPLWGLCNLPLWTHGVAVGYLIAPLTGLQSNAGCFTWGRLSKAPKERRAVAGGDAKRNPR